MKIEALRIPNPRDPKSSDLYRTFEAWWHTQVVGPATVNLSRNLYFVFVIIVSVLEDTRSSSPRNHDSTTAKSVHVRSKNTCNSGHEISLDYHHFLLLSCSTPFRHPHVIVELESWSGSKHTSRVQLPANHETEKDAECSELRDRQKMCLPKKWNCERLRAKIESTRGFLSRAAGSIGCTLLVNISTRIHTVVYCGITEPPIF